MSNALGRELADMARRRRERLREYGLGHLRLLNQVVRQLAHGRPITAGQVDHHIAALGLAPGEAQQFLRERTERDTDDQIIGASGLSLGDHPHRLFVEGVSLSAWCALDTLFLPALLQQMATIESQSPVTGHPIRLRVSPERVEEVHPTSAVISLVLDDPSREQRTTSVEGIWSALCNHVHFFADRGEGEQWARGRDNIAIITVDEGFELGRQAWSEPLGDSA